MQNVNGGISFFVKILYVKNIALEVDSNSSINSIKSFITGRSEYKLLCTDLTMERKNFYEFSPEQLFKIQLVLI